MKLRFLIGAVLLAMVALLPDRAEACSCMSDGSPCQALFRFDAVFTGVARGVTQVTDGPDALFPSRRVAFTVERVHRGRDAAAGKAVDIFTGSGGGDCGYSFKPGERYLVFARRTPDGRLSASICSRTKPIAEAAEELRFIESLPATASGGRVSGIVKHWEHDFATGRTRHYPPVAFAHVHLRGAGGAQTVQTNEAGRYEINNVRPGKYEVEVLPPPGFSTLRLRSEIELSDERACAEVDFAAHYDGRISGTAVTAGGGAAADVPIEVMAPSQVTSTSPTHILRARTDSTGHFVIEAVPPGDYVVGVSVGETAANGPVYPRTFYPGTANPGEATVITVGEGTHHPLKPLQLPPPRPVRHLTVVVVWPDGRPAAGAFISLVDGTRTWQQVGSAVRADADGRFMFEVHEGLSYMARAHYPLQEGPNSRQAGGRAGPHVASGETTPLRIVLAVPQR